MNNSDKVYKEILIKEQKELNQKIKMLGNKNKFGLRDTQIERLKIRSKKLAEEIKEYEERETFSDLEERALDIIEDRVDVNSGKIKNAQDKIRELEELRSKITSTRTKSRITRKIEHQRAIIKRINKRKTTLDSIQRKIMLPRHKLNSIKESIGAKQEAKVNVTQRKLNDIEVLKASLNPDESIIDDFKMIIYDIKEMFYRSKLDRVNRVLEETKNNQNSLIMYGANATNVSKNLINKLRDKFHKNELNNMTNDQNQNLQQQAAHVR